MGPEGQVPGPPVAGRSQLVLLADTPKLTCFYNSRANISCIWSQDGGLPDTSCRIHAKPAQR